MNDYAFLQFDDVGPCPGGWTLYSASGNCYKLSGYFYEYTWVNSISYCKSSTSNLGKLVELNDATEATWTINTFNPSKISFYVCV